MMTINETAQHEAIKKLLKQAIDHNPNLSQQQKMVAKNNIDVAAQQADWVIEMMKMCGYLR